MARLDQPAEKGSNDGWGKLDPELRFGARACAVGLVLAYALVFSLKWAGLMPEHLTWAGLTLAPAALFGPIASLFIGPLWLRHRWWLVFVPVMLLSLAVMIGLNVVRLTQ